MRLLRRRRLPFALVQGVLAAALVLASPRSVVAQDPGQLASRCEQGGGGAGACWTGAVAARVLVGQSALLYGWGSEVPGSASTLGRKIGNTPRMSFSLRAGGMAVGLPGLFEGGGGGAPEVSFLIPAVQAGVALGILDGFSPMATVGGVLSLDVFGSLAVVMPPSSQRFQGSAMGGSIGARVGLLRESFTLPGVSLSMARRFAGGVALGDIGLGDRTALEVDPSVTSIRFTVGKDLFGVGVLAGWGRDDADADATLSVAPGVGASVTVTDAIKAKRDLYFGALSMNFLLLQLSLEGGWANGYGPVPGYSGSDFDPTRGSPFGSLSVRLTP